MGEHDSAKVDFDSFIRKMAIGEGEIKKRLIDSERELMRMFSCMLPEILLIRRKAIYEAIYSYKYPDTPIMKNPSLVIFLSGKGNAKISKWVQEIIEIRIELDTFE